ncbi:MAG: 2-succinyl-5-enolpyruvyl-6-hydroxy-3-cyclohexene-1-carboxylic-acid synthase [Actinomycetes bacterium]
MGREIVTQLVAAGVTDVVVSPGSRSAPVTYAVAAAEAAGWLRAHVRVDERTAGFFAVGLLKAATHRGGPRPVAVVTTSGTAVANLHPVVLEASHSGLPLVVVSTDRPHEWRGTGAIQTTWQPGLFGTAARTAVDMPARANPASVRGQVARLIAAALGTLTRDPGPVQLNVGLAEPLTPDADWRPGTVPHPVAIARAASPTPVVLPAGRRTLAVAGDGAGPAVVRLARAAGWPLLAEPSSGARLPDALVHHLDLLADGLGEEAERVVVFGRPTLSRPVSALLARRDADIVVVTPTARWTDVAGTATAVVAAIEASAPEASDLAWRERWLAADAAAEAEARAMRSPLQRAALALWDTEDALLLGSSNAVRAFDTAVPGRERAARVFANRGLAGIDGLVSTARGLAAGLGEPVRLVLGDLSFVHDLGGLVRGDLEADADLQVVVLDDHGGGIFATLEHARSDAATFDRFFATPQAVDAVAAARGLGVRAERLDVDDLAAALAQPVQGTSVLVVTLPHVTRGRE